MLYNIKVVHLHCVFHGIRFKVNEDWVSVIDTLLFLCIYALLNGYKKARITRVDTVLLYMFNYKIREIRVIRA